MEKNNTQEYLLKYLKDKAIIRNAQNSMYKVLWTFELEHDWKIFVIEEIETKTFKANIYSLKWVYYKI